MRAEVRFRAMGTEVHVVVVGPRARAAAERARSRIDDLEARWSRFRPDSELSRLCAAAGAPCLVSDDTYLLLDRAVAAWHRTSGRYDPTVGAAMLEHGYDRDFAQLVDRDDGDHRVDDAAGPAPGCAEVVLDAAAGLVIVPAGVRLDVGAIAKGLAADLVSGELIDGGATGVVVNVGGDLRVRGTGPDGGRWPVRIEDPRHPCRELLNVAIADAGMASSTIARRRWRHAGRSCHHLVDPTTGRPAETRLVGVTTIAADAWWAEVVATEILLDPDPAQAVRVRPEVAAIGIEADGTLHLSPSFEAIVA